jgi:hypothetical protein
MISQIELATIEHSVEFAYGIIYGLLAYFTFKKKKQTKSKLAKFFFAGFLCLSISGLYGGIAGFLDQLGYSTIPIIGNKILEIYEGLALLALIFFTLGLIKLKK